MDKVLIFGATGKLGSAITLAFKAAGYDVITFSSATFDINNYHEVASILDKAQPDIVINCAAMLGIDACHVNPSKAFVMNALFPRQLAIESNRLDYQLIHFSTDAVFAGRVSSPYSEEDVPNPVNQYGFTKYASEQLVQECSEQAYVFRIPMLFGLGGAGSQFVEKMLHLATSKDELKIASDIITSPSYSNDIAKEVLAISLSSSDFGLYHLANAGAASLYDLMTHAKQQLGFKSEIIPVSYKHFSFVGDKNTETPLVTIKRSPLRHWREAFDDYLTTHQ
jgi:dTDP-4-dehydrorhamnose reductase